MYCLQTNGIHTLRKHHHILDNQNLIISNYQFGFLKGRSTNLQLLHVLDNWTAALDNRIPTDIILMDFKKAFDTVPHERLLFKLYCYGLRDPLLGWVKSFLTGRSQRVCVNGYFSEWHTITSGIPQGSILGPLLFVIYINDMPSLTNSLTYLFADDTKIYRPINSMEDCLILQDDLDTLQTWSNNWLLQFHPSKCFVLTIGKSLFNFDYTLPNMHDNSRTLLGHVAEAKDLGVVVDGNLSFDSHINTKINKANSILGIIRRSFVHLDQATLVMLYVALVRPHIEFANTIWHPYLKKHINAIEAVQRRATKLIYSLKNLPYNERLQYLGLPSLSYRRLRGDMIETYKIIHNLYDPRVSANILNKHSDPSTRGNSHKLYLIRANTELRRNYFSLRITSTWNTLPDSVILAPSLNSFKNRLDKFWHNNPIKYDYEAGQ